MEFKRPIIAIIFEFVFIERVFLGVRKKLVNFYKNVDSNILGVLD